MWATRRGIHARIGLWPGHMFILISHLAVPGSDHDRLESHFRDRSGLVDGYPGFLYLQLLKPQAGEAIGRGAEAV